MDKKVFIPLVVIMVIALGVAVWVLNRKDTQTDISNTAGTSQEISETNTATDNGQQSETADAAITISFTDNGFTKDSYTVKAGQTVKVVNASSMELQFSSDDHPTHTENPELNLTALSPGRETTFAPTKAGSWHVHDHEHPEFTTELVVTE